MPVLTRRATLDLIAAEAASLARIQDIERVQIEGLVSECSTPASMNWAWLTIPHACAQDASTLTSLASALQPRSLPTPALALALLGWSLPSSSAAPSIHEALLSCAFCARRLGLWSFAPAASASESDAPRRTLDAAKEHRSFCPLINAHVQGGALPSAAAAAASGAPDAQAGWQLRLRCALGQKDARPRTEAEGPEDGEREGERGSESEAPRRARMRKSQLLADVRSMLAPAPVKRGR